MLTGTQDNDEIIERVAALDIGKADLVCCAPVPDENRPDRRLQEAETSADHVDHELVWGAARVRSPTRRSTLCPRRCLRGVAALCG